MNTKQHTFNEIKATIQPHMLSKVISALHELPNFPGLTLFKCEGQGRGKAQGGRYVAAEDGPFYSARERIEIICHAEQSKDIVDAIRKYAHTGNPGDGIICVSTLDAAIRVRTGEAFDALGKENKHA